MDGVLRFGPFLGANQAVHPKLLPDGVGTRSLNQRPDKGDLRGWHAPLNVATVPVDTKTITILGRDKPSDIIYWLTWDTIVHAVRSFIADDTTKRTYYTGDGPPKVTDNLMALAGAPFPTSYRDLGIPKPLTPPTLAQTAAGTGDDVDRNYAYAYVSDWGEIGMPQISQRLTCKPGATITISNLAPPPTGAGQNRGITTIRIWRTAGANADFLFLMDLALPATSAVDAGLSVGSDAMPSATWAMPPADLSHLIGLWNGMMAGISGKSVRYCELDKPYAWPAAYETLCQDTPVALGVYEKSLVILTSGRPRLVYGSAPEAMDDVPIELTAACVSPQSVVSMGHGVCWAAPDGLAYVGTEGPPRLLTEKCMLIEDWRALVPSSIIGTQYAGRYIGFYNDGTGLKGFMVDPRASGSIIFFSVGFTAVHFDPLEEQLYGVSGTSIQKWDAGTALMTVEFTSKVHRLPRPGNPAVAEVIADGYPVTMRLWGGVHSETSGWPAGSLRMTKTVLNREPFFLPSGYLADDVQAEIVSAHPVTGVAIAGDVDALKQT